MKKTTIWTGLAILLLAVGGLDLLFGNTNTTILPSWLGNKLNQQWDLLLLATGGLIFWMK